jgi:hypothetical protein
MTMASDVEIDRMLAALAATMNEQQHGCVDAGAMQDIVDGATGGERVFTVDAGGGVHDAGTRARVGAVRRDPQGTWIVERQNPAAANADAEIPRPPRKKGLLAKLGLGGSG